MLVEEGDGVIAEAAEEIVELAFVDVVDAEFVHGRGGWRGVLFVRVWFVVAHGPGGGGQQRGCGQGLQERAAVHDGILAEETSFLLVPPPRFADVSLLGVQCRYRVYAGRKTPVFGTPSRKTSCPVSANDQTYFKGAPFYNAFTVDAPSESVLPSGDIGKRFVGIRAFLTCGIDRPRHIIILCAVFGGRICEG